MTVAEKHHKTGVHAQIKGQDRLEITFDDGHSPANLAKFFGKGSLQRGMVLFAALWAGAPAFVLGGLQVFLMLGDSIRASQKFKRKRHEKKVAKSKNLFKATLDHTGKRGAAEAYHREAHEQTANSKADLHADELSQKLAHAAQNHPEITHYGHMIAPHDPHVTHTNPMTSPIETSQISVEPAQKNPVTERLEQEANANAGRAVRRDMVSQEAGVGAGLVSFNDQASAGVSSAKTAQHTHGDTKSPQMNKAVNHALEHDNPVSEVDKSQREAVAKSSVDSRYVPYDVSSTSKAVDAAPKAQNSSANPPSSATSPAFSNPKAPPPKIKGIAPVRAFAMPPHSPY